MKGQVSCYQIMRTTYACTSYHCKNFQKRQYFSVEVRKISAHTATIGVTDKTNCLYK